MNGRKFCCSKVANWRRTSRRKREASTGVLGEGGEKNKMAAGGINCSQRLRPPSTVRQLHNLCPKTNVFCLPSLPKVSSSSSFSQSPNATIAGKAHKKDRKKKKTCFFCPLQNKSENTNNILFRSFCVLEGTSVSHFFSKITTEQRIQSDQAYLECM